MSQGGNSPWVIAAPLPFCPPGHSCCLRRAPLCPLLTAATHPVFGVGGSGELVFRGTEQYSLGWSPDLYLKFKIPSGRRAGTEKPEPASEAQCTNILLELSQKDKSSLGFLAPRRTPAESLPTTVHRIFHRRWSPLHQGSGLFEKERKMSPCGLSTGNPSPGTAFTCSPWPALAFYSSHCRKTLKRSATESFSLNTEGN